MDEGVIIYDELERVVEKMIMASFKVLSRCSLEGTEENCKNGKWDSWCCN
jgi:hypothetical protein